MEEGILDIKYYDMNTWNEYFNQDVLKLYEATVKLLKIYEQVRNLSGKNVIELIKDEGYNAILLGGVREDGSFTELSASKFYRDVFGLNFDVNAVISAIKVGESINVPVHFSENDIYKTLLNIYSNLDFILSAKGISKPNVSPPSLTDYRNVLETLNEFVETSSSFLSIYNPKTFFVTSLRGTTLKALRLAYPKLNEEIMKMFGLSKILEISYLPDPKKEYTIWGYANTIKLNLLDDQLVGTSIGSAIMIINCKIYKLLKFVFYLYLDLKASTENYYRRIIDDYWRLVSNIKTLSKIDIRGEGYFTCSINKFNVDCRIYRNNLVNFLNDIGLILIYVYRIKDFYNNGDMISISFDRYPDL
ncbi:hypothetical protein [Stygiolobus caldivivus]|uniref:Uncharacterized protein n=1 Tax=Stygiolobus caldivivus TaxID=2824673 RepID=A0A8D5U405_9CREN|nr:hypothetical protein [Stygiolobus caldivivus]BCU68853.1 hypothetical protein KN1_01500 [Stygiolobus caldivivus]